VGPSGEWLALTGGLSTVRGRAPLLVRGWDGGMCWLKLGRHKTISSSAISHEDSLAWLEFGEGVHSLSGSAPYPSNARCQVWSVDLTKSTPAEASSRASPFSGLVR